MKLRSIITNKRYRKKNYRVSGYSWKKGTTIRVYDLERKEFFEPVIEIDDSRKAFDVCVECSQSKKKALLNLKHKFKYVREFCHFILLNGGQIEEMDDEEANFIKLVWEFSRGRNTNLLDIVSLVRKDRPEEVYGK